MTEAQYRNNPLCKHPERYTSDDGQATEHVVTELVAAFVRALQPDLVIETGTYLGQTSRAIGEALLRNGQGHLHTFEKDTERAQKARERVKGLPVTVHASSLLTFRPGPVQFAFLDSKMGDRVPEFNYLRPFLSPGSIVAFHDTGSHHPLLKHVKKIRGVNMIYLPTPRGIAFAEVL